MHVWDGGAATAMTYRDEIIAVYVTPHAGSTGDECILIHDSDGPHRARAF